MTNPNPKENWKTKLGLILVVASSAIGLGNFLRFPGMAVKNGGGAFMIPYIVSFILLGIPICLSEWIMGRMGGRHGHSAPNILRHFISGFPLRFTGAIALIVPIGIYVYYVFIEAWCLAYTFDFLLNTINLHPQTVAGSDLYTKQLIANSSEHFRSLIGSNAVGDSFKSNILLFTLICFILNFALVYLGIAKGIENFARFSVPVLLICGLFMLGKVMTLDNIDIGLGMMWNPDWSSLLNGEVWIAAAGQIFFSLSVGFGIILSFASYLRKNDDVLLSGLTASSLNELVEVGLGGMITIPIGFLFLGTTVMNYGTFEIGFTAFPAIFTMMPAGNFFGALWFFLLFIAAITSSVTMLQPGISFLEEGFSLKRKYSVSILFVFTLLLTLPIIYFNKDIAALDNADFWIGTFLIFILATIQVIIYSWIIGPERAQKHGEHGSLILLPPGFNFVVKYITPVFLIIIFVTFAYQSLPEYINKMNVDIMAQKALAAGQNVQDAILKANIAKWVFIVILIFTSFVIYLVHIGLKNMEKHNEFDPTTIDDLL